MASRQTNDINDDSKIPYIWELLSVSCVRIWHRKNIAHSKEQKYYSHKKNHQYILYSYIESLWMSTASTCMLHTCPLLYGNHCHQETYYQIAYSVNEMNSMWVLWIRSGATDIRHIKQRRIKFHRRECITPRHVTVASSNLQVLDSWVILILC